MTQATAASIRKLADRGDIAKALALGREALTGLQGVQRGQVLVALASASSSSGDNLESLRCALGASAVFKASGDGAGECDALIQVAMTLRMVSDYASALSTLEQAESLARALPDPARVALVLRQIGICSSLVGQHAHALSCLGEALSVLRALGNEVDQLNVRLSQCNARNRYSLTLAADAPERLELQAQSLSDWRALADDCQRAGQVRLEMMARGNYAITLHECARHQDAIGELKSLVPHYETLGMRPNLGLCYGELGRAHQALGNVTAARDNHLQAIAVLQDGVGALDDLQSSFEGLSRAYEHLGDYKAALAALREVRAIDARKSTEAARAALAMRELRIELARLTNQWAKAATQDALTGLANRRGLEAWMATHLPRVEQGESLNVLLMDLDHFKRVNDVYGHATGDEVLRRVARVVQQCCRDCDLAVRYGGEEFVLALAGANRETVGAIAARLRTTVSAQPWADVAAQLVVTISMGVAGAHEASDAATLFALADKRLYAAKYRGRDQVVQG